MSPQPPIPLPASYTSLPYTQISLTHHPASSPFPTPIIILTLSRPKNHNAFTDTMMLEMEEAFAMLDLDERVRVVVVTGEGRMFCAGADLEVGFGEGTEGRRGGGRASGHRDGGGRVTLAIHRCRKPVIAAINGAAVGVGITMTLPMAIRIAYREAKIGFVFARRGLVMEAASSFFLPRLIGHSRALNLTTTGTVLPAHSPLFGPLFSELLSHPSEVLPRALSLATDIAANTSIVSFALMRDLMYRGPDSAEGAHLLDSRVIHDLFSTGDNKEGVASFLEKRSAVFKGTMGRDAPGAWPWWERVDTRGEPKAVASVKESKL